ncbi:hypothetical protein Cni_G02190 [Canna indica]|uniref:Uncharacterized protein n=1 Tax=Canna indica TaxID=4628 RepID=A0AAQ3JPM8_9LILI|nr:hypothetical protein Cni_G02190 [Canna indica]
MTDAEHLHRLVQETDWYNSIVLDALLPSGWKQLPRILRTWLRNYIGINIVYFVSCFLWCFFIYHWKREVYHPKDYIPSNKTILLQIIVAVKAIPWYSLLPILTEYMIEKGWTKCYCSINEVGWPIYLTYVTIYLILIEFGVYWIHRELHEVKLLYKY